VDVVFVTGDAYVDHPSFAMAILGRVLEAAGFRVAILASPTGNVRRLAAFGRPRLFFAISAGNMDSMINHYTANKKVRNDDAYSPGGRIGLRPDRATLAYCQRAREAYTGVPVIAGGVEASLRRLAHYDYWSDTVRRSILLDSKADLVVYGMGEQMHRRDRPPAGAGETVKDLRDMRGVAYAMGASRDAAGRCADALVLPSLRGVVRRQAVSPRRPDHPQRDQPVQRPAAGAMARPPGRGLQSAAAAAQPQAAMDRIYGLPYTRKPASRATRADSRLRDDQGLGHHHARLLRRLHVLLDHAHQGRIIQSRSQESILTNSARWPPTRTSRASQRHRRAHGQHVPDALHAARGGGDLPRQSCVHPTICKLLGTDHGPLIELMKGPRGSGHQERCWWPAASAWTWPSRSPRVHAELAAHHVGGLAEGGPEHTDPDVLAPDAKPAPTTSSSSRRTSSANRAGRQEAVHRAVLHRQPPGQRPHAMIDLACSSSATATARPGAGLHPRAVGRRHGMYYTGLDPFTKKPVYIARTCATARCSGR
jgi:uncharacterized radical SAM protein YgiQ